MHEGPEPPHVTLAYVRALYAAGRLDEALELCRRLLARDAPDAQLHAVAGMLSFKKGDAQAAERHYRDAVRCDGSHAEAHFNWGNVLEKLGRSAEAIRAWQRAVDLEPGLLGAHNNLGGALLRLGEPGAAEASYRRALALSPRAAHLQRNLGTSLHAQGKVTSALIAFRRAVELEPRWPKALQSLATTAMELGEWALARGACARWLGLTPGNAEALGLLSIALDEQGDTAAADELLDVAQLLLAVQLEAAPGGGSLTEFNAALARQALEEPSLSVPSIDDPRYHCPTLLISEGVATGANRAGADLQRWVVTQVESYLHTLRARAPTHPLTRGAPGRWELASWFAVLDREGQLEPHVHYESYVSAVYYARVPEPMRGAQHAGYFELSGGPSHFPCRRRREPHAVRPREGLLLLFPSYFYHRTLPFHADSPRISAAFDAVPLPPVGQ